ncbi:sigma 54-interacting transcriptional regulator [Domibacillus epiphyticus]|uniref:HTH-type transcriptional regulatory protein TyrR n=1 Tax=Domibacillus epiphyticus TaxID=1714355 RepID=A0A1V2A5N7_9BACI|nr:sigma 54-interacting transcriptional regulator [Domibacillus epiphyticus]OMP66240.1 Fis family transcriptional regulator [Domibacillus epiphyticus]
MIIWKDILESVSAAVDIHQTIGDTMRKLTDKGESTALVMDGGLLVGYTTIKLLTDRLIETHDFKLEIPYKNDILKVPQTSPVEFFHNVSLIIGEDDEKNITGYSTIEHAHKKLNELKFTRLNELLNGAGVGMIRTNTQFEIEFINEEAESILGLPESFLLSRNYKTLLTIDKDLDKVMDGETIVSVNSSLNFKQMSGNFYPLKIGEKITGLVHIFFLRETFVEAVQELDFVRNLYSDLQAVYASSQEQIIVIDNTGEIIRAAGTFLEKFWQVDKPEDIIGKDISEFSKKNLFQPDVFDLCVKQKKKVTAIQESNSDRRIWSVATPVYHEGNLEKVVILSRDITQEEPSFLEEKESTRMLTQENGKKGVNDKEKQLVYRSQKIDKLLANLKRVAKLHSTILLEGESGVGKEIFAYNIHMESSRSNQPLIRVNCGAIPEQLIESELFGYEKGAFTGASQKGKAGLFEVAHRGTLFLDEIGELPFNMQVKLLRVLQEKEVTRIGGVETIPVDVRIVTATNRDLKELVERGDFREDLYYRLNVIPFRIPPLRDRKEDILPLAIHFFEHFKQMYDIKKSFTPEALDVLETYGWPGNVRELQNIIERLIVLNEDEWLHREHVLESLYGEKSKRKKQLFVHDLMPLKEAVEELETQLIERGIQKYRTAAKVSEVLGVSPATISRRMKKKQQG